jgi:RNA polymerase sigma-70 factor (ECF subfamily)
MGMPLSLRLRYHTGAVTKKSVIPAVSLRDADDPGLVAQARGGDYRAFEELVRRYRNDVFALSYHYVREREEAWDLTQEVFVKAHGGLKRFRGDSSFKTWLLRITANRCKDFFKKRRLRTVALESLDGHTEPPALGQQPDRHAESKELGAAIDTALKSLPEKHRTAIVLREFQGLSYEAMAEVMQCNVGTVMSRLHHARKKMQRALLDMGVVEGR